MKAQTMPQKNEAISNQSAIDLLHTLKARSQEKKPSLQKLIKHCKENIPEILLKRLLYIDLLQHALPTLGINAVSSMYSIAGPANPISPYFLEAGRAKAQHIALLVRYVQSSQKPSIALRPHSKDQVSQCLERTWELAHNVLSVEEGLIPLRITSQAEKVIQTGTTLTKNSSYKHEMFHSWIDDIVQFANDYYLYCLKSLEKHKHL